MKGALSAAVAMLTFVVLGLGASVASAGGTSCTGTITGGTIYGGVTAGPGCYLDGVTVNGNVTIAPGGSLETFDNTSISGNLQSKGAVWYDIEETSIGGNVLIQGTTASNGYQSYIYDTTVQGNLAIQSGVPWFEVGYSTVGGNVQFHNNSGNVEGDSYMEIYSSTVTGNVEIHNNTANGADYNALYVDYNGSGYGSIGGNLDVHNNTLTSDPATGDSYAELYSNDVGGNMNVHNNALTGEYTVLDVDTNTVQSKLQCHNDTPLPEDFGSPNTAGQKLGECAAL